MRGAPFVLAVGVVVGCVELVDPSQPQAGGARGTRLVLHVSNVARDSDSLHLWAYFVPGADSTGSPVPVLNDTMFVGGLPVPVGQIEEEVVRHYRWSAALDASQTEVAIDLPAVGDGPGPARLVVPLVRRTGPAAVTLVRGEDLLLPMSRGTPGSEFAAFRHQSWSLDVWDSTSAVLRLFWNDPVPSPLALPGSWLASVPVNRARVQLSTIAYFEAGTPFQTIIETGRGYNVSGDVATFLEWTLMLTAAQR